jgi:hypothetical protein
MQTATVIQFNAQTSRTQKIAELREILAEKFPTQHPSCSGGMFASGIESLDAATGGGLRKSATTEITGSIGGTSLLISGLLSTIASGGHYAALVDGNTSFDLSSIDRKSLSRLLWISCERADQAIKATDLLLRDGNLSFVILDLQLNPVNQLRRIPASTWHRFQQIVESSSIVFLVLSSKPMVSGARTRIHLNRRWSLQTMREKRKQLLTRLEMQVSQRSMFVPGEEEHRLQTA